MVATRLAFMQWFYALGKNFSSDVDPRMVKRSSLASGLNFLQGVPKKYLAKAIKTRHVRLKPDPLKTFIA